MALVAAPTLTEVVSELGPNWRIKLYDADGFPLTMLSFEAIDFGAISYKEVFQNVKTILTTPMFSAALERTLGVDQSIIDLPIDRAAEATVAIIDALYFWEPRCEVRDIHFEPDVLNGKLEVSLTLRIRNVIFGSNKTYERTHIYTEPTKVSQELPPMNVPVPGPPGPVGPTGQRGSRWFTGTDDPPPLFAELLPYDMYLNISPAGTPGAGDVWQFDGGTGMWVRKGKSRGVGQTK
jgi:phage baseplate assembly protein W